MPFGIHHREEIPFLHTRSVTRLKGRINWFFFSSCTKKMKEVAVVTLDEGVRGMCGEINPFRRGEQFPFYNLCVLDHITHTYLEPPAGFFGFFNPIHAPLSHQNQKLDFFLFQSLALSRLSMLLVLNPRSLYQKQPKRIRSINVDGKVQL